MVKAKNGSTNTEFILKYFLTIIFISLPLFASDFDVMQRTAIYGGLSVAIGEGGRSMNPGLNAGIESLAKFKKIYGLGGCVEYTWMSADLPASAPKDRRESIHIWDASVLQKVYFEIHDKLNVFGEFAPGFYFALLTIREGTYHHADVEPLFGLSFGTGVNLSKFIFVFNVKVAFGDYDSAKWITFSVGYGG